MMKRILPVAIAALALSVGAAAAEPPMAVTEADLPGIDNHPLEQLTDTEMASVSGKGVDCATTVRGVGKGMVILGVIGMSHSIVISGQVTMSLASLVCAL